MSDAIRYIDYMKNQTGRRAPQNRIKGWSLTQEHFEECFLGKAYSAFVATKGGDRMVSPTLEGLLARLENER